MNLTGAIIFPGTFNPIHNGHLKLAEYARQSTGAKKVILVPAYSPYHKENQTNATPQDRLEMTRLAVKDNPKFEVSDIEFQVRDEKTYTVNTIKELIKRSEDSVSQKLKLLIGADSFENLDTWYKIKELADMVRFVVVTRPGKRPLAEIKQNLKTENIEYEQIEQNLDVSSTLVREKIKKGQDISGLVPEPVARYIYEHKLYVDG